MSWSSVLKSLLAVCTITHSSVSSAERYGCVSKQCANGICIPYSKNCESSKGCFFKEQKFEDPSLLLIEERGCSTDVCTELAFSTTLGSGRKFRYKYQCCFSEKCNQNLTHGSPPSTSPNGLECPACYNNSGSVCEPVPLKCTGAETKCVKVSGKDMGKPGSVIRGMGCATKTACNLKNMSILNNVKVDIFCSSGGPSLKFISSVLTISFLFLRKSLL